MKKNNKIWTFVLVITILSILLGVVGWRIIVNKSSDKEIPEKINNWIRTKTEQYTLDIKYPSYGIEKIDSEIKKVVEKEIDLVIQKCNGNVVTDTNDKISLTIGSSTVDVTETVKSLLLEVCVQEGDSTLSRCVYTFNMDLKKGEFLSLEDIFKGEYLAHIAELIKERDNIASEEMIEGALFPYEEKFSKFTLQGDGITFYLDLCDFEGEFPKEMKGNYIFNFSYHEFGKYIRRDGPIIRVYHNLQELD